MEALFTQEITIGRARHGGFAIYGDGNLVAVAEKGEDLFSHVSNLFELPKASFVNTDLGADASAGILMAFLDSTRACDNQGNTTKIVTIKAIRDLTRCTLREAKDALERVKRQ